MRIRTTSTQRTYRYVRLAVIAATVFLGVAVGIQVGGAGALPSISAAYYTPAGPALVGSLSAIALALLALSGRSLEQALLDVAAVLALVVAYVPTTVRAPACAPRESCVAPETVPAVVVTGVAVAVVVVLGALFALVLARVQRTASRGVVPTVVAVIAVVVCGGTWAAVAPTSFLDGAHNAAAVAFFAVIALVAGLAAWHPHARGRQRRGVRGAYAVVAIGIVITLILLVGALLARVEQVFAPLIFVGESVALALFGVFWIVQTVELWDDDDPPLR